MSEDPSRLEFWNARWEAGRIGFHQAKPSPLLVKHAELLAGRRRVTEEADHLVTRAAQGWLQIPADHARRPTEKNAHSVTVRTETRPRKKNPRIRTWR